jgi:ribulose-5-phosphate 4-epimerase/fuculose-1-phosphate aldolase
MQTGAEAKRTAGQLTKDLALAYRIIAHEGHAYAIIGILAAREPGADNFWIKSMYHGLDEITPTFGLMRMNLDGMVLEGDYPVHGEWSLMAEIFRARPDVGGIVHTHAPYVCMLMAADREIEPYDQFGVLTRKVAWFRKTPNRVYAPELAREVAASLGQASALFMKYHGIITVGPDIRKALFAASFLELAAKRQVLNEQVAGAKPMDAATADALAADTNFDRITAAIWSYYERTLGPGVIS